MQIYKEWKNGKIVLYNFSEVKYNPDINQIPPKRKELKTMKKIIALMLVLVLSLTLLTACGGD